MSATPGAGGSTSRGRAITVYAVVTITLAIAITSGNITKMFFIATADIGYI